MRDSKARKRLLADAEKKVRMAEQSMAVEKQPLTQAQTETMIHDLRVHQIELEMQNSELSTLYQELEVLKGRYYSLYDMAPEGYLIISRMGRINETNLTAAKTLGFTKSEMLNKKVQEFIFYDDQDIYYHQCNLLYGNLNSPACEVRMVQKNGDLIWMRLKATIEENVDTASCRIIMSDISLQKKAEMELIKSEKKYKALFSNMSQGLVLCEVITDNSGKFIDGQCIEANASFMRLFKLPEESVAGKRITEIIEDNQPYWLDIYEKVVQTGELNYVEYYFDHIDKYYGIYTYKPENNRFAIIVKDLAENIKQESEITFLSYHDHLTGLYNRRFYVEELKRLDTPRNYPLTLAVGDINGLKLVNDSFGHVAGDKLLITISEILKEECRHDDIIARIGGDEFVLILPNTDETEAGEIITRIQKLVQKTTIESVVLSISFGCATKNAENIKVEDVFKDAEDKMYHDKLYESHNVKNRMIDTVMKTLYEKNNREALHSQRVGALCEKMAIEMKYNKKMVNQIKMAGLHHDIGKVALDESVLNCPTVLNETQWKEMKKHPEIGCRILGALIEMSEIANFTLEHHERWDGKGYPKGLKGDEISIVARIVTLAAAYDAMTTQKTYKSALNHQEAIKEIISCSGTLFDPDLVKLFVEKIAKDL